MFKESLAFDLRRLRRRVLDGFMEKSMNLDKNLWSFAQSNYGTWTKELPYAHYEFVARSKVCGALILASDTVGEFRETVWSWYKPRYAEQDILDYKHVTKGKLCSRKPKKPSRSPRNPCSSTCADCAAGPSTSSLRSPDPSRSR